MTNIFNGSVFGDQVSFCNLNYSLPDSLFDLQASFGSSLGTEARIALYKAVEYCNIPAVFSFHNALNDSVYTALVGEHIKTNQLTIIPQKRRENRSKNAAWPRSKKCRYGPFLSIENVLNSRACRHAACPLCGKTVGISNWFFANSHHYYSKFSCPDHGKYIYHLEPLLDVKSKWWGSLSVLEACTENMAAYRSLRGAKRFRCKQSNHSRKRSRAYLYI